MRRYPLLLGVDVGTTNVRSFVFNEKGEVLGQAFREMEIHRPKRDWAEEEPEELWRATLETIRGSVKTSKISPDDVAMISFSAQMHGMSMIDREGKVLVRLLTWLDLRAAPECEKLGEIMNLYELYSRTGCPPCFVYPFVKILWVKENMPKIFGQCYKVLSAKDYIMYRMLGEPYLDHSVAAGSQLLNIQKLKWDDGVLEIANIDEDKLPVLCDGNEVIGELPRTIAKLTGLKSSIPIILGASDGALGNVGLGSVEEGIAAANIGSSGAIRVISDKPFIDGSQDMRFFCYYVAKNWWLPGGAINNAGIVLRWFREVFGQPEIEAARKRGVDPYEVMVEEAAAVTPGAGGLIMVPFFAGERFPVRDPKAKGTIFGLTLAHGRAHVIRAIMESVVFTLKWIMEAMEEQGLAINEVRVSGGGARSRIWRQIQADVLGKPVAHTKIEEASALGAAMLAAISLGIYKDLNDASRNMVKIMERHTPNPEVHSKYEDMFQMYKDLYGALRKFMKNSKDINLS